MASHKRIIKEMTMMRKSAGRLLKAVSLASYGLSIDKMDKARAREIEKKAVQNVIGMFGLRIVLKSVMLYKRALSNMVKDGRITIVKNQGTPQESKEVVPIYTYGVDQFFRDKWPREWKEVTQDEKKTRPKNEKE